MRPHATLAKAVVVLLSIVRVRMTHCVIVRAYGKELDYLRGGASRIARSARIDWWTEPRELGTAFCFETANTRTLFCAVCVRLGVNYAVET